MSAFFSWFLCLILFAILNCDVITKKEKKENETTSYLAGGTLSVSIEEDSIETLPTYSGTQLEDAGLFEEAEQQIGTLAVENPTNLISVPVNSLDVARFFMLQCHTEEPEEILENFCPENIKEKLIGLSKEELFNTGFKLTTYTLLGIIDGATMNLGEVYNLGDPDYASTFLDSSKTIDSYTFVSSTGQNGSPDTSGDPYLYFLDIPDFYDRFVIEDNIGESDRYIMHHLPAGDDRFGIVFLGKNARSSEQINSDITSFLTQVYLTTEDSKSTARILASNAVDFTDYYNEDGSDTTDDFNTSSILLMNLKTKRFIVKYAAGHNHGLVALGTGGRDRTTGELLEGYYYVKSFNTNEEDYDFTGCVNNMDQTIANDSNCSEELKLADNNLDIANYLGFNETETRDLAEFINIMSNADYIPFDKTPADDAAVSVKHIPDRILVE